MASETQVIEGLESLGELARPTEAAYIPKNMWDKSGLAVYGTCLLTIEGMPFMSQQWMATLVLNNDSDSLYYLPIVNNADSIKAMLQSHREACA